MFRNNHFDRLENDDYYEFILIFLLLTCMVAFVGIAGWYSLQILYSIARFIV